MPNCFNGPRIRGITPFSWNFSQSLEELGLGATFLFVLMFLCFHCNLKWYGSFGFLCCPFCHLVFLHLYISTFPPRMSWMIFLSLLDTPVVPLWHPVNLIIFAILSSGILLTYLLKWSFKIVPSVISKKFCWQTTWSFHHLLLRCHQVKPCT